MTHIISYQSFSNERKVLAKIYEMGNISPFPGSTVGQRTIDPYNKRRTNNCTPVVVEFVILTLFEEMMKSKNNEIVFEERIELGIYPNLT
jgi:hypothetical protein